MMNQIVLVGRIVNNPEVKETDNGKHVSNITIAVNRSYKNADGVYETDFIDCELWNNTALNTFEYCKPGDVVGIKGRIKTDMYEKDGKSRKKTSIVAEKITFLSSSKSKENDEININ